MSMLELNPAFDWRLVQWSKPHLPEHCSVMTCHAPVASDAIRLFGNGINADYSCVFCDRCAERVFITKAPS